MKMDSFISGNDVQRSTNIADDKLINLYVTTNSAGTVGALVTTPGLDDYATISASASGIYTASNGRCFYVSGTTLYELSAGGSSVSRGTVTAGITSFSDNGIELILVNGTDGWLLTLATNVLKKIKVLTGTATITICSPAVVTSVAHGLTTDDRVMFYTTGIFPDGISTYTPYYVLASGLTADVFKISLTSGGSAINTTVNAGYVSSITSPFAYSGKAIITSLSANGGYKGSAVEMVGFNFGTAVQIITDGVLPSGISALTDYYICGTQTITITIASPAVLTFSVAAPSTNDIVRLYSSGALPTGLSENTPYYVINLTATTANLSLTKDGAAINTTGTQSGTHSFLYGSATTIFSLATSIANIFSTHVSMGTGGSGNYKAVLSADMPSGTNSFKTIGYGFPNGAKTVSYCDGRFVTCQPNTQNFYVSEVLNGSTWDALNVQTADSNPDYVIGQTVSHNELIVFCEKSGEVFYDSGTYPSPFVRNSSGIFEVGCIAPYSICSVDNSIMWLGKNSTGDGIIYRLNGYTPVRISTYTEEYAIQGMSDVTDAKAFTYQQDGHHFYVITFPTGNRTFVYDANTQLWHERASWVSSAYARWKAEHYTYFDGKHLVTDRLTGKISAMNLSTFTENGDVLKWTRSWRAPGSDMKRVRHNRLTLDCEAGVGVSGGATPTVMLRYSNDGGHTWSTESWMDMGIGDLGEYSKRVYWNRLGITSGQPRIYELSGTSGVKTVLIAAYLE